MHATIILNMQVSLEQDSKVNNIRDSLATNITSTVTMLSNLISQPCAGTACANLSGINVFESCVTLTESNCTVHPATVPGASPVPCITPEVLLNQVSINIVRIQ